MSSESYFGQSRAGVLHTQKNTRLLYSKCIHDSVYSVYYVPDEVENYLRVSVLHQDQSQEILIMNELVTGTFLSIFLSCDSQVHHVY